MNGYVLGEQYLKILGFSLSSKLDLVSYIVPIAKTASMKIKAWFVMRFFSPSLLYLYKSTICGGFGDFVENFKI